MVITQSELQKLLHYNRKTGVFTRLTSSKGPAKKGDVAGHQTHPRGYVQISLKSKGYYAHRLAWLYVTGNWPKMIDHINGDTSDNRFVNLRECSMSENMQNLKRSGNSRNRSGQIGVSLHKGRWRAVIRYTDKDGKRKRMTIGHYSSPQEATAAYNSAKLTLHRFHPSNTR